MKLRPLIAIGISLALVSGPTVAAAHTPPQALPVGTCLNIGNTMELRNQADLGDGDVNAEDFLRIKAAGFETVRIPVRWDNKSANTAPYTVDPEWMARVERIVGWAMAADLNVILNSHHFEPIHENPLAVAEWHGAVWRQIAEKFAGQPEDRLWFELENEPHENFDHSNLLETLAPALAAVRESNPTRAVIIGGENWSGIDSLETLPLPDDANIYPTFHYYSPFAFSHQGASWVSPDVPPAGRMFPTADDREQLKKDVAKVEAYIERTGKVPFMGETGAYDLHISTPDRAAYHRAVRDAFAPTGIGMCAWAYANTFPLYDKKKAEWLPGMVEAFRLPKE